MTNATLARYWSDMEALQKELREKRERHLNTRSTIRKIQTLRVQIMKLENPLPRLVYRVKAKGRWL